ncbi:MAG: hypothetical protein HFG26_00920 [Provencibacterium sp.]|jgi:YbbR domain-containing protein|nr:hypothetical protein [Provencibacterium sp.]
MKLKNFFQRLLHFDLFLKLISLAVAFFVWVVVATAVDPSFRRDISGVPIDINLQSNTLSRLGMSVISLDPQTVRVRVNGTRYVVGELSPEDIRIEPDLSAVNTAGTQTLPLRWVDESGGEYTVELMTPQSASVRIDRMDQKTLDITANVTGVSLSEGYIKEDEIVTPERVTLTGPIGDLNKVHHAMVNIDMNKSMTATESVTGEIVLVDVNGNVVESGHIHKDYDAAEVTVSVLKVKEVPLSIEFINRPYGFPMNELNYTLDCSAINIAGPQTLVDSYDGILLGYVDFKRLDIGTKEVFDVQLPSGFDNIDNIQSVSVSFDMEGYVSQEFNLDTINIVNPPANYDVTIPGSQQMRVRMVGPAETLESMTPEDIIAEVDLSEREAVTGQTKWPVKIYAPRKGAVWAVGDYVTTVSIAAKAAENER